MALRLAFFGRFKWVKKAKKVQKFKSVGAAGKEVFNKTDFKTLKDAFLKKKGIDPHAFKREWLGTDKNIKFFDIVRHKETKELMIIRKSTRKVVVRTYQKLD